MESIYIYIYICWKKITFLYIVESVIMDIYIDKENPGGMRHTLKRKKKGLSVRKRALQTLEETNISTIIGKEETIVKQHEKDVEGNNENQNINISNRSKNEMKKNQQKLKSKNTATPVANGNKAAGKPKLTKFKMPDYIKNFGNGPSRMKKNTVAFGTPRDKASNNSNNGISNKKNSNMTSVEKRKLLTRLGGAKRITSGSSSKSSNNNTNHTNTEQQATFENTTSSILNGLQNTTTKLEAIHEVDNNKTLNSLGSTTSHSSSSSENTATNITNSIKSEIKKKSTLKKANTPSITSSSNKKITTPVNIKLDYIKNWVPGKRTKSMTSSSNASDNNTNINNVEMNNLEIKNKIENKNNNNSNNNNNNNNKNDNNKKSTTSNNNYDIKQQQEQKVNVEVNNNRNMKKNNENVISNNNNKTKNNHYKKPLSSKKGKVEESNKNRKVRQDSSKSSTSTSSSKNTKQQSKEISFNTVMTSKNIVSVSGRNYMRLEQIGRGGSSKVYKVLGNDMKIYALKRIRPQRMNRKTLSIFQNEINLMVALKGKPNIIQLIDAEINMEKKCIYMVMEMGDIDLNHLLKKRKEEASNVSVASNENFLRITWQQMLEAVHTIHQNRIVHSDLKPANFLCVKGVLKLIDFGIAKTINDDTVNIHRESQIGTINYMSPESITDTGSHSGATPFGKRKQHMKLGRSSDIWSLGCILYQMVYGKTPFAHLGLVQKLQAITNSKYEINYPDHPNPALINTIKACLQRDPKLRPTIDGPNGLLTNEFLNPKSNINNDDGDDDMKKENNASVHVTSTKIDLENMSDLVDGLLDLGHRLGATKNERDKRVREKLALELYNQFKKGKPFDLEDALDSAVSKR